MITRIEGELLSLRNIIVNYPKQYRLLKEQLTTIEKERQDLLHVLELGNLNAVEQSKIARELKEVSLKRRLVKDDIEVLEGIYDFTNGSINKNTIGDVIGKTRGIIKRRKNRKYNLRVRKDLQPYIDRGVVK